MKYQKVTDPQEKDFQKSNTCFIVFKDEDGEACVRWSANINYDEALEIFKSIVGIAKECAINEKRRKEDFLSDMHRFVDDFFIYNPNWITEELERIKNNEKNSEPNV